MSKLEYQIKTLQDYERHCIQTGCAVWPVIDAMREAIELMQAKQENCLIVLPVPIGAPVYVIYPAYTDIDGTVIPAGVEELHLSGYVNEKGREFYLTYNGNDSCDVSLDDLYTTRAEAEAALKERDKE